MPTVGGDDCRGAAAADAGIDNADEDDIGGKDVNQRSEQVGRCAGLEHRGIVKQIDDRNAGSITLKHGFDLAHIRADFAEIGEQDNHGMEWAPRGKDGSPRGKLLRR